MLSDRAAAVAGWSLFAAVLAATVGSCAFFWVRDQYADHTLLCTVDWLSNGSTQHPGYRIHTEECGQFTNRDSWWTGKIDSDALQELLQPGHRYRLEVAGPTLPSLDVWPNVIAIDGEVDVPLTPEQAGVDSAQPSLAP